MRLNDGRTAAVEEMAATAAAKGGRGSEATRSLSHTSYLRAVNLDNIDRRLHHSAMTQRQSLLLRRSPCPWQPQTR